MSTFKMSISGNELNSNYYIFICHHFFGFHCNSLLDEGLLKVWGLNINRTLQSSTGIQAMWFTSVDMQQRQLYSLRMPYLWSLGNWKLMILFFLTSYLFLNVRLFHVSLSWPACSEGYFFCFCYWSWCHALWTHADLQCSNLLVEGMWVFIICSCGSPKTIRHPTCVSIIWGLGYPNRVQG